MITYLYIFILSHAWNAANLQYYFYFMYYKQTCKFFYIHIIVQIIIFPYIRMKEKHNSLF